MPWFDVPLAHASRLDSRNAKTFNHVLSSIIQWSRDIHATAWAHPISWSVSVPQACEILKKWIYS